MTFYSLWFLWDSWCNFLVLQTFCEEDQLHEPNKKKSVAGRSSHWSSQGGANMVDVGFGWYVTSRIGGRYANVIQLWTAWNLQAASAGRFTWGIWGTGETFRSLPCGERKDGIRKGHEVCIAQVLGSFWKGGCYEIFSIFYKVLDPFPVSCLSLTRFNRFRSHIFKLAKVKIRLFGAPAVSDRHWLQTLNCKKSHARPCIFACLAGTLWPQGSKGLSRFPRWFRHQTHQGRVWIPRRVQSTQKSRPHETTWDAQSFQLA